MQLVVQILAGSFTPADGSVLPLRAIAYEPLGGMLGESALARQHLLVDSAPRFELALDESLDPVAPSGALLYTLTYSNVAAGNIAGTSLALELPPGVTFLAASDGGTHAGGIVSWVLGTVASGFGGTRQVLVQVGGSAPQGALLRARGRIQDSAAAPESARSRAIAAVQSGASLLLEIEATPDPVRAAETLTVELIATNIGAIPIDAVVDLRIDEHSLTFPQNLATRGGNCTGSGNLDTTCAARELVRWDIPPLGPGERIALQAVPQIPAGSFTPPNGTILPLRAEAFVPGGVVSPRRYARQSVLVHSLRALELALDESHDPVDPGADLVYTVLYSNPTGAARTGVVIELPLPAGTSFVSASDGGTQAGGVVTWNLGTLPAGQAGTRQATLHVAPSVAPGATLTTRALISDGSGLPAEASARAVTAVTTGAPLRLEIEANPDPIRPAETADVLLTVTNVGGAIVDPVLELRVDEHTISINQNLLTHGGDCTTAGNLDTVCAARELIRWDLPPLAPGERMTVGAAPQIPAGSFTPPEGTVIPWRAEVFEQLGGATGANRSARHSVLVRALEPFELALDVMPDPSPPNGNVTYTATFGNTAGTSAVGTTLSLPIPPGFSFVSASGGGAVNGGAVTWPLGSIPSGRGGKRTATLRDIGTHPLGTLTRAAAEIQDSAASPNSSRGVAVSALQLNPPLALAISSVPNPAQPVNFLDTTLTLTNQSAALRNNLLLETRLPGSFLLGFAQAGGADCTISGDLDTNCESRERIRWSIASLGAGAQTSFLISPQVSAGSFTPPNGTLLRFVGIADGSQALGTHTVRIGISEDKDGDGRSDWLDNCPSFANPTQSDIGGVGASSGPDGVGDACQCGDVNGNGRVTTADATLITRSLLVPPTAALTRPDLCNVGGTASCTTADAVIVTRALLVPPTAAVGQVCAPGLP